VAYFKLLLRYAPRETERKYFNAVCPEEIPQRRQYTTTSLEWIIIQSINIKKKNFNPLVQKFRSRFLPLKSSNTCIFSIFRKNLKLLNRMLSIVHLSRSFTYINVVLPTGTLQIRNTFSSVNCLQFRKIIQKQISLRRSTRFVLPRVPHANPHSPSFI
jgi:hypothetical protein